MKNIARKSQSFKLATLIFLSNLSFVLTSCNAQTKNNSAHESKVIQDTAKGDTVKKLSDHLWYVFQDTKNNYWFASNGEGVFRYDGKTIINFTRKHGLCNDTVRQIQEDKFGNIFISTFNGINKYDGNEITKLAPIKSSEWKLGDNDMWFYILGKKGEHGPYRYDGKNLYNLEFPKHFLHEEIIGSGIGPFFSPYEIYSIYKDRKGAMWFGTSVLGACRFDGQSVKWMYEKDLTITPKGGTFGIRSVFEDREGKFWICNTKQRFEFDLAETAMSDRLQYKKIDGIGKATDFGGDDYVYYSFILEDQRGDIWFCTWDQGVFQYDGSNIIKHEIKDGAVNVNVISLYKDRQDNLWLGTPENGVLKFNGKKFERFNP